MGDYSDLLYARPSFSEGVARALDLGATLNEYNRSMDGAQANAHALRSDFAAVNQDMWRAWEQAEQECAPELASGQNRA